MNAPTQRPHPCAPHPCTGHRKDRAPLHRLALGLLPAGWPLPRVRRPHHDLRPGGHMTPMALGPGPCNGPNPSPAPAAPPRLTPLAPCCARACLQDAPDGDFRTMKKEGKLGKGGGNTMMVLKTGLLNYRCDRPRFARCSARCPSPPAAPSIVAPPRLLLPQSLPPGRGTRGAERPNYAYCPATACNACWRCALALVPSPAGPGSWP
jgi:hypothetical protein